MTITNTSASSRARVIERIIAGIDGRDPALRWNFDLTFIGRDQYLAKYENQTLEEGIVDVPEYSARAIPFRIAGGSSIAKIIGLEGLVEPPEPLQTFLMTVTVGTASGESFEATRRYQCGEKPLPSDRTRWCGRTGL